MAKIIETNEGGIEVEGQPDIDNDNDDNDVEEKEDKIKETPKETLTDANTIDLSKDKDHPWWDYTFNAKNKYFIHIQFKAVGGSAWNKWADWSKHGARYCFINSKPAQIISVYDPRIPACQKDKGRDIYDTNEVITIKQNDKIYKLFYLGSGAKAVGWCFDDGIGIFQNITRTTNGKVET